MRADPTSPGLRVKLWQAGELEHPIVICLNSHTLESMRLLAVNSLPALPGRPGSRDRVWATIPIEHVSAAVLQIHAPADG